MMNVYEDERGWLFKVMPGLGVDTYKARYKKPEASGWHCVARLPWRSTVIAAQEDLDEYARRKGWRQIS